ncbi:MAG: hypothetical protein L6V87_05575 [Ruminococcus sp.]|nr:MAG: hypothetical protein L6V87_05575 [Ruminococcus sp.]
MNGKFHIFSDCLMYVCGSSGEIEKTVSLGALIEITGSDICDAEKYRRRIFLRRRSR